MDVAGVDERPPDRQCPLCAFMIVYTFPSLWRFIMLAQLTHHLLSQRQPLRFLVSALITVPLASGMAVGTAHTMGGLIEPLLGASLAQPAFLFGYCAGGYGTIAAVDRALQVAWPARG